MSGGTWTFLAQPCLTAPPHSATSPHADALPVLMERGRPSCPLADMGLFGLAIRVNPKFQAKVEALVASAQASTAAEGWTATVRWVTRVSSVC